MEVEMATGEMIEPARIVEKAPLGAQHARGFAALRNAAIQLRQLLVERCHLVFDLEHGIAARGDKQDPGDGREADHAASELAQGGADVRSAARSRAERARGLRAIS